MKVFKRAAIGTFILMTVLAFQNCGKLSVELDEDGNILSSSTAGYRYNVVGPSMASAGDCTGYILNMTDMNGAFLTSLPASYVTETVTFPASLNGLVFEDASCTSPVQASYSTDDLPLFGYVKVPAGFNDDVFALISGRPTNRIRLTTF